MTNLKDQIAEFKIKTALQELEYIEGIKLLNSMQLLLETKLESPYRTHLALGLGMDGNAMADEVWDDLLESILAIYNCGQQDVEDISDSDD